LERHVHDSTESETVLFDWSREAALAFALEHRVPTNPLHAKDLASIGCSPCMRAVAPGEPERAGRWWREVEDKKEYGLHTGVSAG
jgi:phosphoadenosine phosphosulfate reductase